VTSSRARFALHDGGEAALGRAVPVAADARLHPNALTHRVCRVTSVTELLAVRRPLATLRLVVPIGTNSGTAERPRGDRHDASQRKRRMRSYLKKSVAVLTAAAALALIPPEFAQTLDSGPTVLYCTPTDTRTYTLTGSTWYACDSGTLDNSRGAGTISQSYTHTSN
jgi:hypothetical protein